MKLKNFKISLLFISVIILTLGLSISFQSLLAAWVAPAGNPPTCLSGDPGCDAPLNSGPFIQTKAGALWINTDGLSPYGLIVEKGKVGIGTTGPANKLQVQGGHGDSIIRIFSDNYGQGVGGGNTADLVLWASEPGWTWTGTGIGNNMIGSPYYGRRATNRGASYIRLLDNAIYLNTVNSAGADTNNLYMSGGNVYVAGTAYANGQALCQANGTNCPAAPTNADTVDGYHLNQGLLTSNSPTFAGLTTTGRYYSNEWIQMNNYSGLYSPNNAAHFYPNNASYGSWRVAGSRNGWQGLEFDAAGGQLSLMMGHTSQGWGGQQTGIHNNSYGWLWRWDHGTLAAGNVPIARIPDIGSASVNYANSAGTANTLRGVTSSGPHGAGYYHIGTWGGGYTSAGSILVNGAQYAETAGNADTLDSLHASSFCQVNGTNCPAASTNADTVDGYHYNNLPYLSTSGGILSGALYIPATQAWSGNPGASYGKIQYHANRWYIVSDSASDRIVQFRRDGTDTSYIDNSGTFIGNISGNASYANSAGNADTVDGYHAGSGLLRWNVWDYGNYYQTNGDIYMGWAGNWLSTVLAGKAASGHSHSGYMDIAANRLYDHYTGGAMYAYNGRLYNGWLGDSVSVNYANSAGNADTTDGQHLGTGNSPTFAGLTVSGSLTVGGNLSVNGSVWAGGGYSGAGCDVAERYAVSKDSSQLEPGDLAVLDQENEGKIKKSDMAYSTMIVGVISTKPNLEMGVTEINKDQPPVALLGHVPTKVTTENGAIKIGDLIVSSSKAGYGMRCDDYQKCQGAVVGKAMENFEAGEGKIEVLIKTGF